MFLGTGGAAGSAGGSERRGGSAASEAVEGGRHRLFGLRLALSMSHRAARKGNIRKLERCKRRRRRL